MNKHGLTRGYSGRLIRRQHQFLVRVIPFLLCLLFGCTPTEEDKTRVTADVLLKKEIRIETVGLRTDSIQVADIVEGDSTVFLYSEYTDYGEEGSGRAICFYIDEKKDFAEFSHAGNKILVIAFGTGMAVNFADTVETYDFQVSILAGKIRIDGQVGEINISGTYVPK